MLTGKGFLSIPLDMLLITGVDSNHGGGLGFLGKAVVGLKFSCGK